MTQLQAGLLMLAVIPVLVALIALGWRARARRQADVAALPAVPDDLTDVVLGPVEGTYVSTTTAGDWLDRVVARGLGVRSALEVGVHPGGVMLARSGAPDVWVPAAQVAGARRERGMAGKFVDREGLVVVTWRLGDRLLDTGIRTRFEADRDPLVAAVLGLLPGGSGEGEDGTDDGDGAGTGSGTDGRDVEVPRA